MEHFNKETKNLCSRFPFILDSDDYNHSVHQIDNNGELKN